MNNNIHSAVREALREWEVIDFDDDGQMSDWAREWGVDLLDAATTRQPTQSDALREAVIEECAKIAELELVKLGSSPPDIIDNVCNATVEYIAKAIRALKGQERCK
jgi:hypothetical protein